MAPSKHLKAPHLTIQSVHAVVSVVPFENNSDIVCSLNIARDTTSTKPLTVIINTAASVTSSSTPCTEWASSACRSQADGGTCARGPLSLNVRCMSRVWPRRKSSTTRTPLPAVVLNGMSNLAIWAEHRVGRRIAWVCVHNLPPPSNLNQVATNRAVSCTTLLCAPFAQKREKPQNELRGKKNSKQEGCVNSEGGLRHSAIGVYRADRPSRMRRENRCRNTSDD